VHSNWLADDKAISHELSDCLARVCVGDLVRLIGIEPNLALSAAYDGGRQTFLCGEVDPILKGQCQLYCRRIEDALEFEPRRG